MRRNIIRAFIGAFLVSLTLVGMIMVLAVPADADATDEYPIPSRILKTTCTVDQYMAAVRDTDPVYYERYLIDYKNKAPGVQQATRDRIYWFWAMDYAGRRAYSEETATNAFYEQLAWNWPNWAKLFFNNKGVTAHGTDVCLNYPPADPTVWTW